jgi:uncharacterized protein (DUF1800 family)
MERLKAGLATALSIGLVMPPTPVLAESAQKLAPHATTRAAYQSGQLHGDERILHALNRFTFGPRPGDLEAVRAMGLDKWFAQQLHPETIDNADLEARLAEFPAMQDNTADLLYRLPSGAIIRQTAAGKLPMPESGALRIIYSDEIARYQVRQQQKEQQKSQQASLIAGKDGLPMKMNASAAATEGGQSTASPADTGQMNAQANIQMNTASAGADQTAPQPQIPEGQIERLLALPPPQRLSRLAALQQPELDAFRKALKGPQRAALTVGLNPAQKEFVAALDSPNRVVNEELAAQRLTRDIYSNAQLQEVMTDFWLNHFNVYLHKNEETPYYLVSYERDVIRPLALGKFEDLLEATAHSPAMLLYLDNSSSMGPDSPAADHAKMAAARKPDAQKKAPEGLNENYARELMELHTLGVNGSYTQADVTQVARVFTGWTVDRPQRGGGFKFDENRHEPGTKKVLGKKIKEHGELEGREVLHMLAMRPATAKFISRKLAIRFVGDEPPQALVDRMAASYLSSGGNITAVLQTLYRSPEFWSNSTYRAKVKTPIEYVVSAARASSASADNLQPLVNALREMGMPLYGAVPPTGYKWEAADWVSTGALVNRMNFALTLAANRLPGVAVAWAAQPGTWPTKIEDGSATRTVAHDPLAGATLVPAPQAPAPEAEEQRLESLLVAGGLSAQTRTAVLNQFQAQSAQNQGNGTVMPAPAKPINPAKAATALEKQDQLLAGLLLGSPEFQRR